MACRASVLYDPAVAVNKSGTALSALTAFDATATETLTLTFTAPASGKVLVRLGGGAITGATTFAQILLGVIEASPSAGTLRGRVAPQTTMNGTPVAASMAVPMASWVVSGLTAGQSYTWRAAYAVEAVGGTGAVYRYGGLNDALSANAAGGIVFEIWDA